MLNLSIAAQVTFRQGNAHPLWIQGMLCRSRSSEILHIAGIYQTNGFCLCLTSKVNIKGKPSLLLNVSNLRLNRDNTTIPMLIAALLYRFST